MALVTAVPTVDQLQVAADKHKYFAEAKEILDKLISKKQKIKIQKRATKLLA